MEPGGPTPNTVLQPQDSKAPSTHPSLLGPSLLLEELPIAVDHVVHAPADFEVALQVGVVVTDDMQARDLVRCLSMSWCKAGKLSSLSSPVARSCSRAISS